MGDTTYVPLITVRDMQTLAGNEASSSTPLYGSGSPEGVKIARPGTTYWDTVGQSDWRKNTGIGNTGWVQVV